MGVRGLTSYIAKNAERYLEPFELHDCNLVIDGDSLSSNLYRWNSQCNSAFGGDYDQYYRTVIEFFDALRQCNITPYVLLDGGYPRKKLATVRTRLRAKIGAVKHINPFACLALFPLLMREVFVDALKDSGIAYMRCIFEADDEVAILARKLNCPVLSYDSDFYIHNVKYIPSVTLTAKVKHKKIPRKLQRKDKTKVNADDGPMIDEKYKFLDCCLYKIENLVKGQLNDDQLPLFAALLGNDYVSRKLFKSFYNQISLKNCGGKRDTKQQRRIIALLKWLQHETHESALKKVLGRLPKEERSYVLSQIKNAMSGYNTEESRAFTYFFNLLRIDEDDGRKNIEKIVEFVDYNSSDYESDVNEEDELDNEIDTTDESDSDDNSNGKEEDNVKNIAEIKIDEILTEELSSFRNYQPPEWILSKILNAAVPRYFIDLLYLKLYVNAPQIENFILPDCNEIALPILQFIFTLLQYPDTDKTFQYLTRVQRISNVHYKKFSSIDMPFEFNPMEEKNENSFRYIFDSIPFHMDIFKQIELIPMKLKLFILSIAYFANKSKLIDIPYIHAVIICYCVLGEADKQYSPISRDYRYFQKHYANILKVYDGKRLEIDEISESTKSIADICNNNLTKDESIAFVNHLLPHFYINDSIRERHTNYSSTIIHTYAELQSILFHLNSLNSLLNHPYESINIAQYINGTFLYNMYVALKDRPNIQHYVKHHVFRNCTNYMELYEKILKVLEPIVRCLMADKNKMKKSRLQNRRRNKNERRKKLKCDGKQQGEKNCENKNDHDDNEDSSESEFEDVNNMYSKLLLKN